MLPQVPRFVAPPGASAARQVDDVLIWDVRSLV
jgi:hypothetical protein